MKDKRGNWLIKVIPRVGRNGGLTITIHDSLMRIMGYGELAYLQRRWQRCKHRTRLQFLEVLNPKSVKKKTTLLSPTTDKRTDTSKSIGYKQPIRRIGLQPNDQDPQLRLRRSDPPTQADCDRPMGLAERKIAQGKPDKALRLVLMGIRWSAWGAGLKWCDQQLLTQAVHTFAQRNGIVTAHRVSLRLIQALFDHPDDWIQVRSWSKFVAGSAGQKEARRALFALIQKKLKTAARTNWLRFGRSRTPSIAEPDKPDLRSAQSMAKEFNDANT